MFQDEAWDMNDFASVYHDYKDFGLTTAIFISDIGTSCVFIDFICQHSVQEVHHVYIGLFH